MALRRLDARGTYCPVPLLLTARVVAELAPGDVLEVIGDDPEIRRDIPAWCAQTGHQLLEMREEGRLIVCRVEVAARP